MPLRFLYITFLSLLFACQRNDNGEDLNYPFAKIADKKWQIVSNLSIDSSNNETDLYNDQEDFKKDDYFIFNSDSTYELNDNILLQSDSTAKILDAGRWELSSDGQYLLRTSDMYPIEYFPAHIVVLTADSLRTETSFPADNSKIITGFKRIP